MADILNIGGEPIFDNCIIKMEIHTYNSYVSTKFGHSDEIPIQQQDLYTYRVKVFSMSPRRKINDKEKE